MAGKFKLRDVVTYSDEGRKRLSPAHPARRGYVAAILERMNSQIVKVRWDGKSSLDRVHENFLELAR